MSRWQMWSKQMKKRDAGRIQWRWAKLGTRDLNVKCPSLLMFWIIGLKLVAMCGKVSASRRQSLVGGSNPLEERLKVLRPFPLCPSLGCNVTSLLSVLPPCLLYLKVLYHINSQVETNHPKCLLVTTVISAATLWFRKCSGEKDFRPMSVPS